VNDPKVSKNPTTQTKGQIKMRFKDQQGKLVTVSRSFQLTNKKGEKQEFKQLEQYIQHGTGKDATSITQRCQEIDKIVPVVMGVSPAVLQNVIFCHQEESNWVLGEPKILKDKFDAIFASSRYSQALDAIKKLQTEQRENVKVLVKEEEAQATFKKQAHDVRKRKSGAEEEGRVIKSEIKKLEELLLSQDQEISKCEDALSKFAANERERSSLDAQLRLLKNQKSSTEERVSEYYEEGVDDLLVLREQMREKVGSAENEREEVQQEIERCKIKQDRYHDQIRDFKAKETALRAEAINQRKVETDWTNCAKDLAHKHGINERLASQPVGVTSSPLYTQVKAKAAEQETCLRRTLQAHDTAETKSNEAVTTKQRARDQAENQHSEKQKRIDEQKVKLRSLREKLNKDKPTPGKLEDLKAQLQTAKTLLDSLAGGEKKHEDVVLELETEEKELDSDLKLKNEQKKNAEGEYSQAMLLKEKIRGYEEQKEQINEKLKTEQENIRTALGRSPSLEQLSVGLSDFVKSQQRRMDEVSKESATCKAELNSLKASCTDKQEEVENLQHKLSTHDKQLDSVKCNGSPVKKWEEAKESGPIDKVIAKVDKAIANVDEERKNKAKFHSMQENFRKMVESYKTEAKKQKGCPLCKRGFHDSRSEQSFIEHLDSISEDGPELEKQAKQEAAALEDELQALRKIQIILGQKRDVEARLVDAQKQVEDVTTQLSEKEQEEAQIEEALEDSRHALQEAQRLEQFVMDLDVGGMLRTKQQIEEESAKKGTVNGSVSDRVQLETEIEQLEAKLAKCRTNLKEQRREKDEFSRNQQEKLHNFSLRREAFINEQYKVKAYAEVDASVKDGEQQLDNLKTELSQLGTKIPSLERELRVAEEEKRRMTNEHREARKKLEIEVTSVNKGVEKLGELEEVLMKYNKSNKEEKLAQVLEEIENTNGEIKKLDSKRDDLTKVLEQKEIGEANEREMLRNLDDNIDLKKVIDQIRTKERESEDLREELLELPKKEDIEQILKERKIEVQRNRTNMDKKKGRMATLEENVADLKHELSRPEYHNIDEKYKMKSIELQTTKCAQKDLEKYYLALDKALMRYHEIKMEEINKIVKEIWQVTYKGDDIDTIQIKADLESTGNRRSHNYRLVMKHRHLAELDMRGRCSAGQKVLASLVVRMALAETFCHNCGILALDEPTSNLDERNIAGFTEALSNIVNQRKQQNSSFQLVVISHDKDFIDDLARDTEVPVYYRVEKNPVTQSSQISKHACTSID